MSTARLEIRENKQYFWFFMNCLSWIYIREKKTKRYSESHKELAFLATFSAKRKSMLGRFKEDEIPPSVRYIVPPTWCAKKEKIPCKFPYRVFIFISLIFLNLHLQDLSIDQQIIYHDKQSKVRHRNYLTLLQ